MVSEDGSVQATYAYDGNGNRASLTYANGTEETYTYNKANWITSLTNQKDGTILSGFTYTYYASGSQKSETDHTGKVRTYVYDGLNRLTQEAESGGLTVDYTYDAAGNRSRMAVAGTETYTTTYTYDANNRLLTETKTENGSTGETVYTYDANGNTLSKTSPEGTTVNTYNSLNQLTGVATGNAVASYAYNAQGIRTAKRVNNVLTDFLLDGGNVAAEVQDGAAAANYLRGINLISRESGSGAEYYLYNAHGDVVTLTDGAGAVTRSYDYDAFGNETAPDAEDTNPFRYCGEYWDAETGTYYLRARYYAPDIGRFTQQDTHWNIANSIYGDNPQTVNQREDALGLRNYTYVPQIKAIQQSSNLYLYCISNPLAYTDRSGCIAETPFDVASLIISMIEVATDPSNVWAWLSLAADTVDLIPFITGLGEGTRALRIALDSADDLTDALKFSDLFSNLKSYTKHSFRENLQKFTKSTGENLEAHHVLPNDLAKKFADVKINVHNPIFGAWVDPTAHRKWSYRYNKEWEEFFNSFEGCLPTIEQILEQARKMAEAYGFTIYF